MSQEYYDHHYLMKIDSLNMTERLLRQFIEEQQETIKSQNTQIYVLGIGLIISLLAIIVMASY